MRYMLCLLLIGCASSSGPALVPASRSIEFKLDESFTTYTTDFDYEAIFKNAADAWTESFDTTIDYNDRAALVVQCSTWAMGTAGATTNAGGIAIDCLYFYGLNDNARKHLIMHEVGHALGLQHVNDNTAIMFPYQTETTAFTATDWNEYVRVNGWTER